MQLAFARKRNVNDSFTVVVLTDIAGVVCPIDESVDCFLFAHGLNTTDNESEITKSVRLLNSNIGKHIILDEKTNVLVCPSLQ